MPKTALIMFAKKPSLGFGKQRLAQETSAQTALDVANYLLAHTVFEASQYSHDIIVSPSSSRESEWAHSLFERSILCIPQDEGSLGERLMQVDREARMLGYTHTLFIGTDAPLLSVEDLESASVALNTYNHVFIPARDGGVVLMANQKPWHTLNQVDWSTEKVLQQLKSNVIARGLSFKLLQEQDDLDDLCAYKTLKSVLTHTPLAAMLDLYISDFL